jgi:hypothetical protein
VKFQGHNGANNVEIKQIELGKQTNPDTNGFASVGSLNSGSAYLKNDYWTEWKAITVEAGQAYLVKYFAVCGPNDQYQYFDAPGTNSWVDDKGESRIYHVAEVEVRCTAGACAEQRAKASLHKSLKVMRTKVASTSGTNETSRHEVLYAQAAAERRVFGGRIFATDEEADEARDAKEKGTLRKNAVEILGDTSSDELLDKTASLASFVSNETLLDALTYQKQEAIRDILASATARVFEAPGK